MSKIEKLALILKEAGDYEIPGWLNCVDHDLSVEEVNKLSQDVADHLMRSFSATIKEEGLLVPDKTMKIVESHVTITAIIMADTMVELTAQGCRFP